MKDLHLAIGNPPRGRSSFCRSYFNGCREEEQTLKLSSTAIQTRSRFGVSLISLRGRGHDFRASVSPRAGNAARRRCCSTGQRRGLPLPCCSTCPMSSRFLYGTADDNLREVDLHIGKAPLRRSRWSIAVGFPTPHSTKLAPRRCRPLRLLSHPYPCQSLRSRSSTLGVTVAQN